MIKFFEERCQGCELCTLVCPKKILSLDKNKVNKRGHNPVKITNQDSCTQCSLCAIMCPDCVIELEG